MNSSCRITRFSGNPILTASMVPYPATMTFNAGVAKYQGRYVMVFRDECGFTKEEMIACRDEGASGPKGKTVLGLAFSNDGYRWEVQSESIQIDPMCGELCECGVYDPRLTVIDGVCHLCFAVDTPAGIRAGIAKTEDFSRFEMLSLTLPDNRNMVLFPEKVNGNYLRLDRPFPVSQVCNGGEYYDIWLSKSPDLRFWGDHKLLLRSQNVPFANTKIGPGAPPVKTRKGWLTLFHAVEKVKNREFYSWHGGWNKIYRVGVMLLDLDDPSRIIGFSNLPLMEPETPYELEGLRGNVIFPGGMILEESGEVKIYYGAADTVEALATAHVDDLLAACRSCEGVLPQ